MNAEADAGDLADLHFVPFPPVVARVPSSNGLLHRFVPDRTPSRPAEPMGDREGAFLMCQFWRAQAWMTISEPGRAKAALARGEATGTATGLFSEAADARRTSGLFGNMPLLFSQTTYATSHVVVRREPDVVANPGRSPLLQGPWRASRRLEGTWT